MLESTESGALQSQIDQHRKMLLISNSSDARGYLVHCARQIKSLLQTSVNEVLFIPHALQDKDKYAEKARSAFENMGYGLRSLHEEDEPRRAVEGAQAIFVGGGNTFRLLKALHEMGVIDPIREKLATGMPYIGASAGSNVSGRIHNTNDMPIVQPLSFTGLEAVPFNLNPHFVDFDPKTLSDEVKHKLVAIAPELRQILYHYGETRMERVGEFHEEEPARIVIGLRENAMLCIDGMEMILQGDTNARVIQAGGKYEEFTPGSDLRKYLIAA